MTPAARLALAIDVMDSILAAVTTGGPAADLILSRRFAQARFAGSKDRAAVRLLIYEWLRGYQALAARVPAVSGRTLALAHLGSVGAAEPLFGAGGYGPTALSPDERLWLDAAAPPLTHWQAANLPEGLVPVFERRFGAAWPDASVALNSRAPTDLRVNLLKTSRNAAQAQLADAGIETTPTPLSPWGLRLIGQGQVEATTVYTDGLVEIQDEASQLAALACAIQPGETVIDLCAGAGGKTLALAMGRPGRLIAHDSDARRLARLVPRAARAGVTADFVRDAAVLAGQADVVLVDAPCTGSGTWRRNPEARLRVDAASITSAAEVQLALLTQAAGLLKPGGRLVYAVCSVFIEEGESVIDTLIARRPELMPHPPDAAIWRIDATAGRSSFSFAPHSHGTDGFFIATLHRSG